MAKSVFFITGLPRSRTAWLANLLTEGNTVCLYEQLGKLADVAELTGVIESHPAAVVGVAEPTLLPEWEQLDALFPDAKWVFVERDPAESMKAYAVAFPENSLVQADYEQWTEWLDCAKAKVGARALVVNYSNLDKFAHCFAIVQHASGGNLSEARWTVLNELRVTTMAEKAVPYLHPRVRRMVRAAWRPDTAWAEFQGIAAKACLGNKSAEAWLLDVFNLALTWDHMADNDPLDMDVADDVFQAVLLRWPTNEFWRTYQVVLMPVVSNVIAAWRGGLAYQVYVDLPLAIAFMLGGVDVRDGLNQPLRDAVAKLQKHDDQKDGGLWVAQQQQ